MLRLHVFQILLAASFLATPNTVIAQDLSPTKQTKQDAPANPFGGFLGGSMQAQLMEMATKVIDGYLDFLAKPETAMKLATFQKNYYDALIEKGFTKEQAFELLIRFGNPIADGRRSGK